MLIKGIRNRNYLAGGAETILLDEPTAGMSKSETERATSLIRNISTDRQL